MFAMKVARVELVRTAGEKYVLPPQPPIESTAEVFPALQAETKLRKRPPEGSVGMERSKLEVGRAKA